MQRVKKFLQVSSIFIFSLLVSNNIYAAKIQDLNNPALIKAAESLPQEGVLKQDAEGYIYLAVSPDYINKLYPLLNLSNVSKNDAPLGAHISVFFPKEIQRRRICNLPEIGKTFKFKITGLRRIDVKRCVKADDGNRTWYVLTVDAPELMALRQRFGYSPKRFHPHISIGYDQQVFKGQACQMRQYPGYLHQRNREQQPGYFGR